MQKIAADLECSRFFTPAKSKQHDAIIPIKQNSSSPFRCSKASITPATPYALCYNIIFSICLPDVIYNETNVIKKLKHKFKNFLAIQINSC